MGTERGWTVHRMPGYTGFIPGTRHIYGRSFGRIPPLAHMKERKTEASEISQETYQPKNLWQVLLPPVKFIPGYTGHLPGKNYVFGKTFAQQAEECFINLNKITKRKQEQRMRQVEMNHENRNNYETQHCKSPVPMNDSLPKNMEESRSRNSNQLSSEKPDHLYLKNDHHHPSEVDRGTIRNDHEGNKSRYNLEVEEGVPERTSQRHERHQRYRTQSDGLSRYGTENRNPDEMFKHLKYESPLLKSKYQSSNDVRRDNYNKSDFSETPYPEDSRNPDRLYNYETPNRTSSRMQNQVDNLSPLRSNYELTKGVRPSESQHETANHPESRHEMANAVRPAESRYNLSPYQVKENTSDHPYRRSEDSRIGEDKHDDYGSYNTPDGRHSFGANRDAQSLSSNRNIPAEELNANSTKYEPSYASQSHNQGISQDYYPVSERGGCSCCSGHGDIIGSESAMPSHHHHQTPNEYANPHKSAMASETNYAAQKSVLDGDRPVYRGVSPTNMSTRHHVGYDHPQQGTERTQTFPEDASAYPSKSYDRSSDAAKSVKFQETTPPANTILKPPGLYRTSYDEYNNSAKYFSSALNPPISGYRGYIPRMNSTSALGIPFATHINTNVRT